MDTFTGYKQVERCAHGATKSSVMLWEGSRPISGSFLARARGRRCSFTGSKAHNIVLRDRAIQRGFKLNECGLYRVSDDTLVAGETEEGIYEALGLAYVPPELRENRGEIAAAEARTLPQLLTQQDLRGDLHMHTTATDGRADAWTPGRRGIRASSTSPSPTTARRSRWPTVSTSAGRSSTPARFAS